MKTLAWLLLVSLLFFACEKPLRPPYVTPELRNWPTQYKGVAGLKLHVFKTGEVTTARKLAYRGGSLLDSLVLDILVFAIEHPRQGLVLVGAGLSRAVAQEAESYLGVFRTSIGSPFMAEGQDIVSQLASTKWSEKNVRTLILPDLRFSHTGELENFPSAQIVVTSTEYTAATEEEESALSISDEYDGVTQWRFIDFAGAAPLGTFRAHRDLFGDGSVLLIDVTGATAGGVAVLVRLPRAPVLLCGNLAWTAEQARYVREPSVVFNRQAWWENAWRLKKFTELAPELVVFPDNDWNAVASAKAKNVVLHSFPPTKKTPKEKTPEKRKVEKGSREKEGKKAVTKKLNQETKKERKRKEVDKRKREKNVEKRRSRETPRPNRTRVEAPLHRESLQT
jgi:glyoxylase-like metal-dependent hydrolase (beta-lactamase superfamily II)